MALIPENVQLIEIDAASIEQEQTVRADASDFFIDFKTGRITSQRISGDDAAAQWLVLGCMTERDVYTIYGDFGTYFEREIELQNPRDVAEGEMLRSVEELAAQHEGIRSLNADVDFVGNKALVNVIVNGIEESVVMAR